jgi:hypothetical protein
MPNPTNDSPFVILLLVDNGLLVNHRKVNQFLSLAGDFICLQANNDESKHCQVHAAHFGGGAVRMGVCKPLRSRGAFL